MLAPRGGPLVVLLDAILVSAHWANSFLESCDMCECCCSWDMYYTLLDELDLVLWATDIIQSALSEHRGVGPARGATGTIYSTVGY